MGNVIYSFIQRRPEVETNAPQQVKADTEEYIHTLWSGEKKHLVHATAWVKLDTLDTEWG